MLNSSQKNKYAKRYNRGFTIIESLVAISILSLSIAAAFTAVQGGLRSSSYAKDQITAFYLAQEAMEFMRNKRDENALYSLDGSTRSAPYGLSGGFKDPCYPGNVCAIDTQKRLSLYCGTAFGSCQNIKQDRLANNPTPTYLYGYNFDWTDTIFKREIQFQEVVPGKEMAVTVRVSWTSRGTTKSFQVKQSLFIHQ